MSRSIYFPAIALTVLTSSVSLAGPITPDSILTPPALTSPSVQDTLVPAGGLVTGQYGSLGLAFSNVAVTNIDGVKVWAPTFITSIDFDHMSVTRSLDYQKYVQGNLHFPGDPGTPLQVSFIRFELIGLNPADMMLVGLNDHFSFQGYGAVTGGIGPHGGMLATVDVGTLSAFFIDRKATVTDPPFDPLEIATTPWGVAQIELGTANAKSTPEPSTLVLASLGAMGIITVRRRTRSDWFGLRFKGTRTE